MKCISNFSGKVFKLTLPGLCAAVAFVPAATYAQSALQAPAVAAATLEEIIVTAQKREESLDRAPVAISAYSGDALAARQVTNLADLSLIAPSVTVGETFGLNRLYIRGIGLNSVALGADSSSAFNVDGISIARPSAQLMSFFDVERVEVLRGPQGTLYGRNATGGSINLITGQPSPDFAGSLAASYGNYNQFEVSGYVTGALAEAGTVSARLAFKISERDGFGKNLFTGRDINDESRQAVRASIGVEPNDRFNAVVSIEYAREDDQNYTPIQIGIVPGFTLTGVLFGGQTTSRTRDIVSDLDNRNKRTSLALTANVGYEVTDAVRLESVTGYRHFKRLNVMDHDFTNIPIGRIDYQEDVKQFSQELRAAYTSDQLQGIVGLFYFDESNYSLVDVPQFGTLLGPGVTASVIRDGASDTQAYAAFTQWTYSVTDRLRATAGLRYSHEKKDNVGEFTVLFPPAIVINEEESWSSWTPKFGIDFDLSESTLLFGSVTKGFKSGAYIIGDPGPVVDPETVWAYEIGIKSTVLDNRMRLALSGFYNDYTDLQVTKIVGITPVVLNAAGATIKGVEFSAEAALTPSLRLNADISYLDAKYTEFQSVNPVSLINENLKGNRIQGSPKWSLTGGASYTYGLNIGNLVWRADVSWKSKIYFTEFNEDITAQRSVARVNMSFAFESETKGLSATLYVKNLFDELIATTKTIQVPEFGRPVYGSYDAPRTYGVRIGYAF